jgi:uncharacterized protein (TIGR02996 family)
MIPPEGLLQDIHDHPFEEVPWLVLADWLEEHGDPRAELVRIDQEQKSLSGGDPRYAALQETRGRWFEAHRDEWAPYLKPLAGKATAWCYRGLLDSVRIENATDDDLRHLAGHAEIQLLTLEGRGLTDAGLRHLLSLPGLEEMNLAGTAVTDAGMRAVARLARLRGLGLSETEVSDTGLRHLHSAPRLAHIYCDLGVHITEEGMERWKQRRMVRFRKRSPEERRREAVYVLENQSGTLRPGDSLTRMDLCQCPVSDADLEYFTAVPEVEEIDLSMTHVTGRGIRHLSGLTRLHTLLLHKTYVESLDGLAGLSCLKVLGVNADLGAEHLTDEGTAALTTLSGLERLEMPFADITDLTMHRLAGLRRLRVLDLAWASGISAAGLAPLANLARLERLDLSAAEWRGGGHITDDGLRNLAHLKRLTVLSLEGQSVTDAGLMHVLGLKKLEYLELSGTQATVAGASELLAFLPKVSISVAAAMVKHTNPQPHFTRRDVEGRVSFEVPDDWEVLDWTTFEQYLQIFEKSLAEQFQARLREDGYKHWPGGCTSAAPAEVSFNRFPAARKRKLATIHQAFVRQGVPYDVRPGRPTSHAHPLPGTEVLSWRYTVDEGRVQHLDFAWRREEMCYLMRCRAPLTRFAALEPFFLHMAHSLQFTAYSPTGKPEVND